MLGERLADQDLPTEPGLRHVSVKEVVLPFQRFHGSDALLGPEMKSTGEVMGIASDFPTAFGKAQAAAGVAAPARGGSLHQRVRYGQARGDSARRADARPRASRCSRRAAPRRRFAVWAFRYERLNKIGEGSPHVVDSIRAGDVDILINTPVGRGARTDGWEIRRAAIEHGIPCITTMTGATAAARAIGARRAGRLEVHSLQEIHGTGKAKRDSGPGAEPVVESGRA